MSTYPLDTLAPTIDATGIHIPTFEDIYQSLIASFQQIYGNDIYVLPDSQDGQLIGVFAKAINDSNMAAVAVVNGFSPTYSQGNGLSAMVKINGLSRKVPSASYVSLIITGVAGTVILGGSAMDNGGNIWDLPSTVTIPSSGSINTTGTSRKLGAVTAPIGSITKIATPYLGWHSVTNDAAPEFIGSPIESDYELRVRQTYSQSLPALGIKSAIYSAVGNVLGVSRFTIYENDTGTTDSVNSIPAHSLAIVVEGGSVADVATAIANKKPAGVQTYGATSYTVTDTKGETSIINYDILTLTPIYFTVTITRLTHYVDTTDTSIKNALIAFINGLKIGDDVFYSQALSTASLITTPEGQTFYISDFKSDITASPTGVSNIAIAYNAAASCDVANITVLHA